MLVDTKLSADAEDGGSLRDRLEELYVRLRDVQEVVNKANNKLDDAQYQGQEASQKVNAAEDVINKAREYPCRGCGKVFTSKNKVSSHYSRNCKRRSM